jgi:toxin HigB-1
MVLLREMQRSFASIVRTAPPDTNYPLCRTLSFAVIHPFGVEYLRRGDWVELRFRSHRLQRCAERNAEAVREWGTVVGQRYMLRIRQLSAAPDVETLYRIRALDFHPLTGGRASQHALRLTGRMRLIVTVEGERTIRIEEVVDYHD